jgi:hypothetical protein
MIEIVLSPQLKTLSASLDESWEAKMVEQLPFPLAFHLKHLRQENYPWDFLLKDMLHILLKYLAIIASSDYLHSRNEPDFDVNEQLQNLRLNMSEGHWLRLLRTCSTSKNILVIRELKEIFNTVEKSSYFAKISWPEINIKSDNAGILSTLVTIRNKLLGHGKSPSEQDKQILKPQILGLLRSVLYLYQPVWKYDLVYVFESKKESEAYILRGTNNFVRISEPGITFPSKCFLAVNNHHAVNLFPLVLSDKPKLTSQITLIDLQSEQYILEHIDTHFKPEYIGVSGANYKTENAELNHLLENKKVWTKRQDVELDEIFGKLKEKTLDNLEDIEFNNLYKTRSYLHRKDTHDFLNSFIEDNNSRALIVSGVSGCGKTTAIMHFVNALLNDNKNVLLIRAIELPERVQKPREFERWMVEYLGYSGKFEEVLNYIKTSGSGKLIIVLDGINEFTAIGRDASKLFNNINHFLAAYQSFEVLKVIISFRSDTLNFFLPGSKLPVDALEELYFKQGNSDYFEIGILSVDEGLKLLEILKIPADKAKSIIGSLKENLRTPQVLYKIASGAIAPEDLKGMDSLKITGRFLEKRIGRDKDLKKICYDLVDVMGKAKDMNLTEEQLSDKAPKLLAKLKDNNNHFLNVLSDLEIIQQIKSEDKAGNPSSAILLSHDTIFEALSRNVEKNTNKLRLRILYIGLAFFIIAFMIFIIDPDKDERIDAVNSNAERSILKFDSTFNAQYLSNIDPKISDIDKDKIITAYHSLINFYHSTKLEYTQLYKKSNLFLLGFLMVIIILFGFAQKFSDFFIYKLDKREIRIQFFGKNEKLNQEKQRQKLGLFFILLYIVFVIVLSSINLSKKQLLIVFLAFMMLVFIFSLILPFIIASKTILRSKESTLIQEYFLSKFGRYLLRLQFYIVLGISMILILLMLIIMQIPARTFVSRNAESVMKTSMTTKLATIDLKIIELYPINIEPKLLAFAETRGESLSSSFGQSQLDKFKEVIPLFTEKLVGINVYLSKAQIIMLWLVLTLGLTMISYLTGVLPYDIAARKYYRSS